MSDSGRRIQAEREGFLVALALDHRMLRLRLFGFLTFGRICLSDIRYIRQRGGYEVFRVLTRSLRSPLRYWYWPRPGVPRGVHHSTPFVICTRSGRRVYVRLRPGFHHRLRTAAGLARTEGLS